MMFKANLPHGTIITLSSAMVWLGLACLPRLHILKFNLPC